MPFPIVGVLLMHDRTQTTVKADVVPLTRSLAADQIRRDWWVEHLGVPPSRLNQEDDRSWDWVKFAKKFGDGKKEDHELIAIQTTPDRKIQGAIWYRLDGNSFLEPGQKCVYLERVAVAPRNRAKLLAEIGRPPEYRGVGTALVQIAIAHSQVLGLSGRVNGYPVPNAVEFYERRNFQRVDGQVVDGDVLYEVTSAQAAVTLKETKLLNWGEAK